MKWKRITAGVLALSMLPSAGLTASAAASFSRFKHAWSIQSNYYSFSSPSICCNALTDEHYAVMKAALDNTELAAGTGNIQTLKEFLAALA